MPSYSMIERRLILEIALSRVAGLRSFPDLRRRFANNTVPPIKLTDVVIPRTRAGHLVNMRTETGFTKPGYDVTDYEVKYNTHYDNVMEHRVNGREKEVIALSHEAVHIGRNLNPDALASSEDEVELLPWEQRPSEIEAVALQTPNAAFVNRIIRNNPDILKHINEKTFVSNLLQATRKDRQSLSDQIRSLYGMDYAVTPEENSDVFDELTLLTEQIAVLEERLSSIEATESETTV